jgi:hypothetical protein
LASRYELAYGPDIDLAQIARSVPATTQAALFETVGHLVDDPFPGKSAADVTEHGDRYLAAFEGGLLAYAVAGRTVTLVSVIVL